MHITPPRRLAVLCLALLATASPRLRADEPLQWDARAGLSAWTAAPWGPAPLSLPALGGLRYAPWPKAYALISPEFSLPADPFQALTVTYSAPAGSVVGVSWIGRKAGERDTVGAFVPLPKTKDDAPVTATVQPHWQDFALIRHLQIIVPATTPLVVASVSLSDPRRGLPLSHRTNWSTEEAFREWQPLSGIRKVQWTPAGLAVTLSESTGTLISPPIDAPAADFNWLGATATVGSALRFGLHWACDGAPGLRGEEFASPDSGSHVHNTRLFGATGWRGNVRGLALQISGYHGDTVTLSRIELAKLPTGGSDLRCLYLGLLDPTPEVGQPQTLVWVGENLGGEPIRDLTVVPVSPGGLASRTVGRLDYGVPTELRWEVRPRSPGVFPYQTQVWLAGRLWGASMPTCGATILAHRPAGAPPAPTTALPHSEPALSRWAFAAPADKAPWNLAMGFRSLEVANNALCGVTVTDEPALFGGKTRLNAREFDTIHLRLAVTAGKRARLWWETNMEPISAGNSIPFALQPDGKPHDYALHAGLMPGWRGLTTGFRLDPTDTTGAQIALEEVKVTHELD